MLRSSDTETYRLHLRRRAKPPKPNSNSVQGSDVLFQRPTERTNIEPFACQDRQVINGDIIAQDTRNCLILGHDRLVATNRLRDLVVVETADSVFVSDLEHSRDVKSIVTELKEQQRQG